MPTPPDGCPPGAPQRDGGGAMSGDVLLSWVLGCLVAGAWYASPSRVPRSPLTDAALFGAVALASTRPTERTRTP